MSITPKIARQAADQYREEGYALVPQFIDGDVVLAVQKEADRVYREALRHPSTWRHGNLAYEILPETDFGKRYVIQAYWMAWMSNFFEAFRRSEPFRILLEPILGREVKQIAQQIHWKPPGAGLTGYRFHQDIRFRAQPDAFRDIAASSVTAGLAIDPSTRNNGCLQVVPGSHKRGYLGLSDEGDTIMKGLTTQEELATHGIHQDDIVWLEQDPGDLALWGLLTVHGSLPNTSEQDRAFALSSYVRADTTDRGEWVFKNGVSTPLGPTPRLCKFEELHERPDPHYVDDKWYA
ncbi:phytanoyl-CoA dioxygenase family protein [Sulfitobacter aestuariivivens]|uniref:Phytanoyl-CoA dioxygenase family protein n=1 Tax=Sulfitobacter aestuariivivens TaxID=2766981 RepID=A0A927D505_9RHOB|nr:phytanoyl-CoA dioxygenase family protein [Sulfitobacter aestuariivivens]MBD3665089.1 phytanoyl-CoA dioxygenase family protein [Sulfitobacter aestuariivivens]